MTRDEVNGAVIAALAHIAPEVDFATLKSELPIREQVDIDSIDFLNFLVEIHHTLGVDVPEADYHQFTTLDSSVAYLASRATVIAAAPQANH